MSEEGKKTYFTKETLIPVTLVAGIIGAVFFTGMAYNKLQGLEADNAAIKDHESRLTKIETLYTTQYQQVIDTLKEIQADIKELKKSS
jgi:hypothetical protein